MNEAKRGSIKLYKGGKLLNRKGLAVGVILLFIGTCIIPAIAQDIEKPLPTSRGNWLYVGGSGPGNYTKIQNAIDNASDGDTVFVYDDSAPYYENIMINKSINLIGENWNTDIIDGNGNGNVVTLAADGIYLHRFRIQNSGDNESQYFAGIKILSNFNCVTGNIITNNNIGILLTTSVSNNISNNPIQYCNNGIVLFSSNNNILNENNILYNTVAFELYSSNYNNISHCVIWENQFGITLENSDNNIIGSNVFHDNYNETSESSAIYLKENDNNNNIISNTIEGSTYGINIQSGHNNNIQDNSIHFNTNDGIAIFSSNNTVYSNIIEFNNRWGITCSGNSTIINDNIIAWNYYEGLLLQADNCIIENNLFINNSNNWSNGGNIVVSYGTHNKIFKNTIRDSNAYGLRIQTSNNTIYHNDFLNNNVNAFEVFNYLTNTWDNGYPLGGNYWSDYTGNDSNKDGIGDIPYNISGGTNKDMYPLMSKHELYYAFRIILSSHEVNEGSIFNVTVKSVANSIIPNVFVTFNGEIKLTDSNGTVRFTAPEVIVNTTFKIIASKPGYINASANIVVKNVFNELKKIFMFGRYRNMSGDNGIITIDAVNIRIILFRPFQFLHYYSNEKLTFSKDYKGIITRRFIIGLFDAVT